MVSVVIVTGAIAPYTNRLYNAVGQKLSTSLAVLTCSGVEPQRKWSMPEPTDYELKVLSGLRRHLSYTSHVYVNPSVVLELIRRKPTRIIIDGFSPTMVLAGLYARLRGIPLGIMTDGSVETDPGAHSRMHRWMRKLLVPGAQIGLCASADSARLLALYGLPEARSTVIPIVSTWDAPSHIPDFDARPFDLLFCGAIDDHRKGALFFADVVERLVAKHLGLKVRVAGDGPLRNTLAERLAAAGVEAHFDGYATQAQLPEIYASAKVFCFPSREEPWGLVANEAVLCGTPVVASEHTTSGRELIAPFGLGSVLALDEQLWVRELDGLLSDPQVWHATQARRDEAMSWFSVGRSSELMVDALALDPTAPIPRASTTATPSPAAG